MDVSFAPPSFSSLSSDLNDQRAVEMHSKWKNRKKPGPKPKSPAISCSLISCSICQQILPSTYDLFSHQRKKHPSDKRLHFCNACNFVTSNAITKHAKMHGNIGGKVQCDMCSYSCSSKQILSSHRRNCHGAQEINQTLGQPTVSGANQGEHLESCPHCPLKTKTMPFLEQHMRYHQLAGAAYHCHRCSFASDRNEDLVGHVLSSHDIRIKLNHCKNCSFRTDSPYKLSLHLKTAHPETAHCCPHCAYVTTYLKDMNTHMKNHSERSGFACDLCSFSAPTNYTLMCHKWYDHGVDIKSEMWRVQKSAGNGKRELALKKNGEAACNICDEYLPSRYQLHLHKRACHPESSQLYPCPYCTFTQETPLIKHLDNHQNKKSFSCHHCTYSSNTSTYLDNHILNCHSGTVRSCPHCYLNFSDDTLLNSHIRILHDEGGIYICDFCPVRSNDKMLFDSHQQVHNFKKNFGERKLMEEQKKEKKIKEIEVVTVKKKLRKKITVHVRKSVENEVIEIDGPRAIESNQVREKSPVDDETEQESNVIEIDEQNKLLKCPHCPEVLIGSVTLSSHVRHHNVEHEFVCDHCTYSSDSKFAVRRHSRTVHKREENNKEMPREKFPEKDDGCKQCPHCPFRTKIISYHLKCHTPNYGLLQCSKCSFSANLKKDITRHFKCHDNVKDTVDLSNDILGLSTYRYEPKEKFPPKVDGYSKCPHCPFRTKYNISYHLKCHTPNYGLLQCSKCSYSTNLKRDITKHFKCHDNVKDTVDLPNDILDFPANGNFEQQEEKTRNTNGLSTENQLGKWGENSIEEFEIEDSKADCFTCTWCNNLKFTAAQMEFHLKENHSLTLEEYCSMNDVN